MSYHLNTEINLLSLLGLIFDIWGVILLFYNGVPGPIEEASNNIAYDSPSITPEREKRIRFYAKTGLKMIIAGFVLQFAGYIVSVSVF